MAFKQIVVPSGAAEFIEQTAVATTSTVSSVLVDQAFYVLTSTINCYFKFGDSTVTVATNDGHYLVAGEKLAFHADTNVGLYVAVIRVGAPDGTASISRVRD